MQWQSVLKGRKGDMGPEGPPSRGSLEDVGFDRYTLSSHQVRKKLK
jgi:hypothetical protein